MSVLCCRIPDFLIQLAGRYEPAPAGRPLILLGPDERVWAASAEAAACGVGAQMSPRQARARCPDACLRPLALAESQSAHEAFLDALGRWGLPVEAQAWGAAYIDLGGLAGAPLEAQPLCAEAGRQARAALGLALQPAIGWDSGKFTASAAAAGAAPGRMRLVGKTEETRFLDPLPVRLLPLPARALQQLDWLGIRTLKQFAALPAAGVLQRFGRAGALAQQWARGRDDRPVRPTLAGPPFQAEVDFEPPTPSVEAVLEALLRALRPALAELAARLEGCRRARVDLRFADRGARNIECAFVEPAGDEGRLRAALSSRLQAQAWPGEVAAARVTLVETGEQAPQQLALFPIGGAGGVADGNTVGYPYPAGFRGRYGPALTHGRLIDAGHAVPERRSAFATEAEPA
jgi:nucleotidyltransferase/DNA polymerase involved in DNA repair